LAWLLLLCHWQDVRLLFTAGCSHSWATAQVLEDYLISMDVSLYAQQSAQSSTAGAGRTCLVNRCQTTEQLQAVGLRGRLQQGQGRTASLQDRAAIAGHCRKSAHVHVTLLLLFLLLLLPAVGHPRSCWCCLLHQTPWCAEKPAGNISSSSDRSSR
jgi:hypothetical protein